MVSVAQLMLTQTLTTVWRTLIISRYKELIVH